MDYKVLYEKSQLEIEKLKLMNEELKGELSILEEEAYKDHLTSAINRRGMEKKLNDNLGHYSIVMLDIDNFKYVNDRKGHEYGDLVLVDVYKILEQNINSKEGDFVVRYGGDEFLLFLKGKTIDDARETVSRISLFVENFGKLNMTYISISSGIINYENEKDKNIHIYLTEADQLLYKSKECGKNRISTSEDTIKRK